MHERTRRTLCRFAFIALGILPTAATLAWTGYRVSPLFAASEKIHWEQRLTNLTGLVARVEHVSHPARNSTLLHQLRFVDPEDGTPVATIRQAEIAPQPQGIVVLLSQPEVAQGKFLRLWDTLHHRVFQGTPPATAVQITSGEVTLEVGGEAQTFTTVRCTVEPQEKSLRAWIEFQLAGVEMPAPAQLRLERNRHLSPPTTSWSLHSATPIPCRVFADYLKPLVRLGPNATFQGTIAYAAGRDDFTAEVQGRFAQVDLDRLSDSLPHKLTGFAQIQIARAVVEQGVLRSAEGTLLCLGGTVNRSLVEALTQQGPVTAPPVILASSSHLISYDRLAFRFAISGAGFSIAASDPQARAAIMTAAGEPLLTANQQAAYPLTALMRALAPDSRHLVPASDALKPLLQLLDFPPPQPRAEEGIQPPRLRLSERPGHPDAP